MLKELRHACDVISMEAVAGGNATDKAAARLPAFLDKAVEFLTHTVFSPIGSLFKTKDLSWLASNVAGRSYSEMRGLAVVAPQGFKGSLAEYSSALVKAVEEFQDLEKDVLSPYGSWLGQRVADPASLKALTNSLKIPGLQAPKLEATQKQLDHYFPSKVDSKEPIYGEVIRRQADWVELYNNIKKLNTLYANGKFEAVQKKVPELSQLLEVLSQRMGEFQGEYQLSSINTERLAKVTFEIAEQIEFYGVIRHRVEELLKVVEQNVELLRPHV